MQQGGEGRRTGLTESDGATKFRTENIPDSGPVRTFPGLVRIFPDLSGVRQSPVSEAGKIPDSVRDFSGPSPEFFRTSPESDGARFSRQAKFRTHSEFFRTGPENSGLVRKNSGLVRKNSGLGLENSGLVRENSGLVRGIPKTL